MAESEAAKIGVSLFHRISRIANSDFSLDEILGQMKPVRSQDLLAKIAQFTTRTT